jgi:hypothetical protein
VGAEHAYTALSRATRRTDLYVDTGEPDLETHAPVLSAPARERVAASVSRSVAQHLAIDQTPTPLVPVEALRVERDRLREQLAGRPIDYSIDLRRLSDRIQSTRHTHELGPVGRRVHRRDRLELERLERSAATDIEQLTAELSPLTAQHYELTKQQRELQRWEYQHQPELARLTELDRSIRTREVATRSLQAEPPTPAHGIELGL